MPRPKQPSSTLIKGIHKIRQVLHVDNKLPRAGRVIDGRHFAIIPGPVNTHHHLYLTLTRAFAPAADAEFFDWLRALYPIWARLDEESVYSGALSGMAELLLWGCTTTTDHHYVFPRGHSQLIDVQIQAARRAYGPRCLAHGNGRRRALPGP
ncbi:hypothetical protein SBA3_410014 [Candidatus Sulfopaludibacter sp. SbA3]|nr:hypothetical protein SBA3_410014 [Candidatus Sulfopaludibacter sp. SbA3]